MKRTSLALVLLALCAAPAFAQQEATIEAEIKRAMPYTRMLRVDPTLTIKDYNAVVRAVATQRANQQANEPQTARCGSQPLPADKRASLSQRCQRINSRTVEHPTTGPRAIPTTGTNRSTAGR
jgi:hypothetical protein